MKKENAIRYYRKFSAADGYIIGFEYKKENYKIFHWIDYIEYVDSGYTYPADSDAGSPNGAVLSQQGRRRGFRYGLRYFGAHVTE